ncbi:alcohol dehydrogenase 2 [Tothia fuscella]|uniref:Alcohol dehydrogenase 2 n=1 Tax=Tothia fuscella TaxID=1048955 RepID=A0A9P4NSS5_9PEZI|nr:alcohol dehydrogenase 2 [Tothia fuscella]
MAPTKEIPKKYKAAIYEKPGTNSTKVVEMDTPEPSTDEVLIRLTHSGVCHSDLAMMCGRWSGLPPIKPGSVGGHEGVGVVEKLGPGNEHSPVKIGDRVGINWIRGICMSCEACLSGIEPSCANKTMIGYFTPGTFQQYVVSPSNYVTPIPDGLSSDQAAPMLCAGLIGYAALRKTGAKSGEWVAIIGAGGGLGHIGVQLGSKGMAYRLIGIDHGSKKDLVIESGAEAFVDFTQFDDAGIVAEVQRITGAYAQALAVLGRGGTLVCVGIPEGEPQVLAGASPGASIGRGINITSAVVGTRKDAIEVLDFARSGVVHLTQVFEDLSKGNLQGRVVLDLE